MPHNSRKTARGNVQIFHIGIFSENLCDNIQQLEQTAVIRACAGVMVESTELINCVVEFQEKILNESITRVKLKSRRGTFFILSV